MKVALIGGTGSMGSGLAKALRTSCEVMVGSRDLEKARGAAAAVPGAWWGTNAEAASWCEAAVVCLPFSAIDSLSQLADDLAGKLVMSIVNPLRFDGTEFHYAGQGRSAASRIAALLPKSRVATAFNNVPHAYFDRPDPPEADVLVAAASKAAFEETAALVSSVQRLRPVYVGSLDQAESVERVTALELNAARLGSRDRYAVRLIP